MITRQIYCYRLYTQDLDLVESIWRDLQPWGGSFSQRIDRWDFYVPAHSHLLFLIKYPDLCRQHNLEYI